MASITQYRGKTWRAIVRRTGFPPQSKTFDLKKDAESWVLGLESRMGVSPFSELQLKAVKTTTVLEIFQRYEREVGPTFRGRNSLGTLQRIIRDAKFMHLLLAKITSNDIRCWRDDRVKQIQKQSVMREFGVISGAFRHAMEEWSIPLDANPCKGVSRYKGSDVKRNKRWSPEDIQKFLKACSWSKDMPITKGRDYVGWALLLGIETAMREGELCSLRVSDFYPEKKFVHLSMTKNGDERSVPLSSTALQYFEILCKDKKPEEKIIPLIAGTLSEYVKDVKAKCGLDHLVFHDTRHEATTRLSKKLPSLLELSAVTGHRNLNQLKRYYHPDATEIAGKLD